MAKIRVRCASCEKILTIPDEARGKKVKCLACGYLFKIASKQPLSRKPAPEPEVFEDFSDLDDIDEWEDENAELPPPRRRKQPARARAESTKGSLLDVFSGRKQILKALQQHEVETGARYELLKAGMPPVRLWLSNRKGDRWGKVVDESGHELWVRYRQHLFSRSSELTFHD